MIFDDVLKKTRFSCRSRSVTLGKRIGLIWLFATLNVELFHKCWLLALWVLDGNEVGSPAQRNSGQCRLSHREAGAILFTTEEQLRCYGHHYYFLVTADLALGKQEKKVSCIETIRLC